MTPYKNIFRLIFAVVILISVSTANAANYEISKIPLERNGYNLYFSCLKIAGSTPTKNILLIHGLTYSSHVFDVDIADYSFAKFLARKGYAVYTLDLTGYGRSDALKDGFIINGDYAAEDFQKLTNGEINFEIIDPAVANTFLANCWKYDKNSSPNGCRVEILSAKSNRLINTENLKCPLLIIEGTEYEYINRAALSDAVKNLSANSEFVEIIGGSHAVMLEKPFYKKFRDAVIKFLER